MFRGKLRTRLMFFEKTLRNWPKRPIGIVVWVEGEIRGYEVVSKHSKRVPACGFCAVQAPCPNSQNCLLGRGSPVETSKRETLSACQRTPAFRKRKLGFFDRLCKKQHPSGCCFRTAEKPVIASQSAPRSKCPWGTDWRGNPSHLRAGCHTRL